MLVLNDFFWFDWDTYGDAIAQRQNLEVLSIEGRLASFQGRHWRSEDRGC
jgi:hypothetical protein